MAYIVSIDQSTAGTKGLVWDEKGTLLSRADIPHRQIINEKGWVSHDLREIYTNTIKAVKLALEKARIRPNEVAVIGISNQRETAAAWDRKTGEPVCEAVVWQCGRAVELIQKIDHEGFAEKVRRITGLNLSPYFSGPKFAWIVENCPEARAALNRGSLCCGTIDSWLVFKFTGGRSFKTDYSNASRTQLLDLDTLSWSVPLMEAFGIGLENLPEICFSDSFFGETTLDGLFDKPVPIHGVLGDSHAALFANRCLEPYSAKATYGTGSSVMMNAGTARPEPGEGIVTSLAWGMKGSVNYVLEGNVNYTGAVIKWLVEEMELIASPKEAAALAASVPDTGGVYLIPAFTGLGAPWFKNSARAALIGLNRGSRKAHLVRAAEECIAYQIRDVVEAINASIPQPLSSLRLDGGPTADLFLMQFQADILGMELQISGTEELSGAGAAWCAALGTGAASPEELFSHSRFTAVCPSMDKGRRERLYQGWKLAVTGVASLPDLNTSIGD
jgi:glycerol kinase